MTILLDTDACIEIIRGNPAPLERFPEAIFWVSWISGFEILSGLRGRRGTKAEKRAKAFLAEANMIGFEAEAAHCAADVRIILEESGKRIGSYDTLLAGHALAHNIPLLTRNGAEFERVPRLQVLSW